MGTDLFQILTLFLLLGVLLTLFGMFLSLGAIRKLLEGRPQSPAAERAPVATEAPVAAAAPPGEEADRPLTWTPTDDEPARSDAQRSGWPAPQEATVAAEPEPSYETPAREPEPAAEQEPEAVATEAPAADTGARVLYGDAGLTTATPSESAVRTPEPAEEEPEPAPASSVFSGAGSSQATEDPQEQPFERDGRWWFRRGDELLVYEEQTGQWVAAPEPSTSGSVAASAPAGGEGPATAASGAASGSTEGQVTTQQEAVGSFWKCPSCGAVNGSTATSCRMCFTARP